MRKNAMVRGVISLMTSTFLVKVIGVVYRIPLTNLLGTAGLGLYQMVFPVYTLLLDFSGAGMPSAISKAISSSNAENKETIAKGYLKSSLKTLTAVGVVGTVVMLALSYPVSILQGNIKAVWGYLFLSPAVFFVSMISCFRGYFQGLMLMSPTSVSQIIEQVAKLILGLFFAFLFMPNVPLAVAGATLGVTLSESVALIYLYVTYKKRSKKIGIENAVAKTDKGMIKTLVKIAVPVTLCGIMIPLSHFIDSFIVVNVLKTYRADATSLYGILSGVVHTVIGLPVGLCYAFAVTAIPGVGSKKLFQDKIKKANDGILITGVVAFLCTAVCYFFASPVINVLFPALSSVEKNTAVTLLRLTAPCILLLSVLQTSNSSLVAMDKPYVPVISLGVGITVKTLLSILLISNPQINIYGSAFALIACYFIAVMINFIVILVSGAKDGVKTYNAWEGKT